MASYRLGQLSQLPNREMRCPRTAISHETSSPPRWKAPRALRCGHCSWRHPDDRVHAGRTKETAKDTGDELLPDGRVYFRLACQADRATIRAFRQAVGFGGNTLRRAAM